MILMTTGMYRGNVMGENVADSNRRGSKKMGAAGGTGNRDSIDDEDDEDNRNAKRARRDLAEKPKTDRKSKAKVTSEVGK